MKVSTRLAALGFVSLLGLVIGYGVVFCFYVAGLFGEGPAVPPAAWEKALRGTILMGPFLGAFLLLGFLAWRERWSTGVMPFTVGALGVILVARKDAGILTWLDGVWALVLVVLAYVTSRPEDEEGDDE